MPFASTETSYLLLRRLSACGRLATLTCDATRLLLWPALVPQVQQLQTLGHQIAGVPVGRMRQVDIFCRQSLLEPVMDVIENPSAKLGTIQYAVAWTRVIASGFPVAIKLLLLATISYN